MASLIAVPPKCRYCLSAEMRGTQEHCRERAIAGEIGCIIDHPVPIFACREHRYHLLAWIPGYQEWVKTWEV